MLAKVDEQLQALARYVANTLPDPDKKQLRFNEIIETAKQFYPNDVQGGVVELVNACDRGSDMYTTRKDPMWLTLRTQYQWMLS